MSMLFSPVCWGHSSISCDTLPAAVVVWEHVIVPLQTNSLSTAQCDSGAEKYMGLLCMKWTVLQCEIIFFSSFAEHIFIFIFCSFRWVLAWCLFVAVSLYCQLFEDFRILYKLCETWTLQIWVNPGISDVLHLNNSRWEGQIMYISHDVNQQLSLYLLECCRADGSRW